MKNNILGRWIAQKMNISYPINISDFENYQKLKLDETIKYAKKSSFYNEKLKNYSNWNDIPFTYPEDIQNFNKKMICVPQDEIKRIVTIPTSGTTGKKKEFILQKMI